MQELRRFVNIFSTIAPIAMQKSHVKVAVLEKQTTFLTKIYFLHFFYNVMTNGVEFGVA